MGQCCGSHSYVGHHYQILSSYDVDRYSKAMMGCLQYTGSVSCQGQHAGPALLLREELCGQELQQTGATAQQCGAALGPGGLHPHCEYTLKSIKYLVGVISSMYSVLSPHPSDIPAACDSGWGGHSSAGGV